MAKLDHWAEDKRAGLKFDLKELDDEFKELKKQIRQTGNLPDKLALQRKARELEKKRDEAWRTYDEAAKHIEVEKDGLLDRVEEQLAQSRRRPKTCSPSHSRLTDRGGHMNDTTQPEKMPLTSMDIAEEKREQLKHCLASSSRRSWPRTRSTSTSSSACSANGSSPTGSASA